MSDVRIQKMQYKSPQQTMKEIFGVVLHTTEAPKVEQTIDRFVRDWNAAQAQSAHFIIDRTGVVGQCRTLADVAWHINKYSINYIGVELIASQEHKDPLFHGITRPQMDSIAKLIGDLAYYFKFPIKKVERNSKTAVPSSDKDRGVAIHADFAST
jgi:N-acetyl-anhydromuramyl-L-alanine amidase AmpD